MGNKLYVGGISYSTTEEGLKQEFEKAGNVVTAKVIKDRETGKSKGFGFVEMSSEEEAKVAIELYNGKTLDGRTVKVNVARPQISRH